MLFLTPSLTEPMTRNTNTYAAPKTSECPQEGGRKWKEVSTSELGTWFGITVYMGVHNSPAVQDYWRHDGLNPAHPISEHMGQTRFEEIMRCFHVSPPDQPKETPLGRRLWHSKVDVILNQLREISQRYRVPSSHIAVDECMMRATGWSPPTRCQVSLLNRALSFTALQTMATSGISIQPQTRQGQGGKG